MNELAETMMSISNQIQEMTKTIVSLTNIVSELTDRVIKLEEDNKNILENQGIRG